MAPDDARGAANPAAWTSSNFTLRALIESFSTDSRADRTAILDQSSAYTYRQLQARTVAFAGALHRGGVRRGELVLAMLGNSADAVVVSLALAYCGAVEVTVNTALRGPLLRYQVSDSGAKWAITDEAHSASLTSAGVPTSGQLLLSTLTARIEPDFDLGVLPQADDVRSGDLCSVMYTSGTTGPAKGVLLCHGHVYGYCAPNDWATVASDDVVLVSHPLFHMSGKWAGVYNTLIVGATAVIAASFSVSRFWTTVQRFNVTQTFLVGTAAKFLLDNAPSELEANSSLRKVLMIPVIPEVRRFEKRFGVTVGSCYGLTEGAVPIVSPYGSAEPGKCGRARTAFDLRLVGDDDRPVGPGEVGELLIRPRDPWTMMLGYHNRHDATVDAWRNLWLHTGDLLARTTDGQFQFVDRSSDSIRRRGENISSYEVEQCCLAVEGVEECAAVAVASEHMEDEVKVVCTRGAGTFLTEEALFHALVETMPYYMVPRYIEFRQALPKTPTNKVRKLDLRDTGSAWDSLSYGLRVTRAGLQRLDNVP